MVLQTTEPKWEQLSYRIGCPVWGCAQWNDVVYPAKTKSDERLDWYSRLFPTVEGNSTFYSLPSEDTFQKWRDSTPEGFRFSFKFPRSISHDAALQGCERETDLWIKRLDILHTADRLGPTFLQLGPSFSFRAAKHLEAFLKRLPSEWMWAVEVRHGDWFDAGPCESHLDDLLRSLSIDRVLFDSRPLNQEAPSDASEEKSQARKPKSPFRLTCTGKRPMVRLIGRNDLHGIEWAWEEWAGQCAEWIRSGLQPWIFTHAPDDAFAPMLARDFHRRVRERIPELPPLPALPDLIEQIRIHRASSVREGQGEGTRYIQQDLF